MRTGRELTTVNVSDTGILVEGEVRLLPGTHIDIHVTTGGGRLLVRSRVLRAAVWALSTDRVVYRAALGFDRHVETASDGYPLPLSAGVMPGATGTCYPLDGHDGIDPVPKSLSA